MVFGGKVDVDLLHLRDDSSSELPGFDIDATLQLTTCAAESSLEPKAKYKILRYTESRECVEPEIRGSRMSHRTLLIQRF